MINNQGVPYELNKTVYDQGIVLIIMSAHGNFSHQEQYCGKVALDFQVYCQIPVMLLRGQVAQDEISIKSIKTLLDSEPRLRETVVL